MKTYAINFQTTPPIGTKIVVPPVGGKELTLVRVDAYTRGDGVNSSLLWWRETGTGFVASSGMRSAGVNWKRRDLPQQGDAP